MRARSRFVTARKDLLQFFEERDCNNKRIRAQKRGERRSVFFLRDVRTCVCVDVFLNPLEFNVFLFQREESDFEPDDLVGVYEGYGGAYNNYEKCARWRDRR